MTTATIENDPVSIQLSNSSTTVPSGEVWKVTIVGAGQGGGSNTRCEINGNTVASSDSRGDFVGSDAFGGAAATTFPFDTVVKDGDTIAHAGSDALHIGGFVVNTNFSP